MMGYPQWWEFNPGPVPEAEKVSQHRFGVAGGGYVGESTCRYCPRCTEAADGNGQPKVPGRGRDVALVRREYRGDVNETYWDCPACHTTWREVTD